MAKHNMLLGQARGKVGDLVFSRAYGKQIVRAKAAQVSNPRTLGQNTQRAIFATIAKAAAAMTAIVDHSFAGIAYGAESVRHFRKENLALLRKNYLSDQDVALTAKGGSFVPNNYLISAGNLPSFTVANDSDGTNVAFLMGVRPTYDDPVLGWDEFKKLYPNVLPGDQLTVVKIVNTGGTLKDGDGTFAMQFDRIIISPDESLLKSLDYIINSDGFNPAACDLTVTTNTAALKSTMNGNYCMGLGDGNQVEQGIYACALILSRKVNGTWQRSKQFMAVINSDDVQDNAAAIASYDGSTDSITSDNEYLDAAQESDATAGISGAYVQVQWGTNIRKVAAGETLNLGEITLADDLQINVTAYGVEGNHVAGLDLYGNNTDGEYTQRGTGRGYNKSLTFNPGDDGNLAGTYKIECFHWADGQSTINFTLAPGA